MHGGLGTRGVEPELQPTLIDIHTRDEMNCCAPCTTPKLKAQNGLCIH
jgi:hypothetical protein